MKFADDNIYNAEMTVVRVNGDMKTEVEIDVEDPAFKITKGIISYSPPEASSKPPSIAMKDNRFAKYITRDVADPR